MKKLITQFLFLLLISSTVRAQDKNEILKHYFEKMGVSEKWLSINSLKIEKTTIYGKSLITSVTSKMSYSYKKPAFIRIESYNSLGKFFTIGADSLGVWQKINDAKPERIADYGIDFIQSSMTIFLANELKNKENIQLKSNETIRGKDYYVLDVKNNKTNRNLLYINAKTYVLDIYVPVDYKSGTRQEPNIETFLSEYKEVSGFLFPFVSEVDMAGTQTKTIITNIQINIPLDNKIFSPEGK